MSSSERKGPASHSDFETDSHQDTQYQSRLKAIRLVDSARVGLTSLALLCGLAILGTSASSLAVYKATHLPREYNLPLWPNKFDLRPTIALVVCSVVVVLANTVSLVFSKVQTVSLAPPTPGGRGRWRAPERTTTSTALTYSPVAEKEIHDPHAAHIRSAGDGLRGGHGGNDPILRGQRLDDGGHAAELELPVGVREHGWEATLRRAVRAEQGRTLPLRSPRAPRARHPHARRLPPRPPPQGHRDFPRPQAGQPRPIVKAVRLGFRGLAGGLCHVALLSLSPFFVFFIS